MRKALLVIAMVAASFAGGAVVNGPGLAWFRGLMGLESPRVEPLDGQGPAIVAPVALDNSPPDPVDRRVKPDDPPAEVDRPAARLAGRPDSPKADDVEEALSPEETSPAPDPAPAKPEPAPTSASAPSAGTEAPRSLDLGAGPPPLAAPGDPGSGPALEAPATPDRDKSPPAASRDPGREPGWGDAPGSAPAAAFLPEPRGGRPALDPSISPASIAGPVRTTPEDAAPPAGGAEAPKALVVEPNPAPAASTPGGWADVRRRMAERGVTRYWAEGEPGGPARFRCVIPLAGKGAVSQQFEAEADDVLSAAEAALRRIDLWRAASRRP